ncbi:hypothetical protein Q3G72_006993 [Acer saccharum]|nr:hypothetical protein Q3G72_006993 [Acer saccharum]
MTYARILRSGHSFMRCVLKVGVDPLASNKRFWAELLGIGDFYYEIGVQIVDICLATRAHNGGLINLQELCKLLRQRRKSDIAQGFMTVDEVERRLSWTSGRAIDALVTLLDDGLAMIDDGHKDGKRRDDASDVALFNAAIKA